MIGTTGTGSNTGQQATGDARSFDLEVARRFRRQAPELPLRPPPERHGPIAVGAWQLGLAVTLGPILFFYVLAASPLFRDCPHTKGEFLGGVWTDGQAAPHSLATAAVLAGSWWLLGGVTAWVLRRRLGWVFAAVVGLFLFSLVVLWVVSQYVWGPRLCDGVPA
jgi:hypothetical protein